jgi:hypothetical protein
MNPPHDHETLKTRRFVLLQWWRTFDDEPGIRRRDENIELYSLFCVRDSFVVPDDRVLMEIVTRVKPQANALLPATHTAREHVRLQHIRLP